MKKIKTKLETPSSPVVPQGAGAPALGRTTADMFATAGTSAGQSWPQDYEGVPYETIVRAWLAQRGIVGEVAVGGRNTTLYQMARELRYIMDFNADFMQARLPHWGMGDTEVKATLHSAATSPHGTEMPPTLKALIAQCRKAMNGEEVTDTSDPNPLPKRLPPLLGTIRKMHPQFPKAAVLAALPALGTLLSQLRCRYIDGKWQAPIFFTVVQAPQASGKSFARDLSDWLTRPIEENDMLERAKEEEYDEKCKRAKNATEQPEDPKAVIRLLTPTVSNTALLRRARNAHGLILYTFAEEIDTILRGNKAGAWSKKDDIYRIAFDGAKWGQDYVSQNSVSGVVRLRYNLLFLGTPLAVSNFFKKVEDGMASRFILAQLPDNRGEALMRPVRISKGEQARMDSLLKQACEEGSQSEEIQLRQPRLMDELDRWQMERIHEYNLDPDNFALDILRRRAALIAFRAGMVAWWLSGRKETKEGVDFAIWVANEVLGQQLVAFGEQMNHIERQSSEILTDRRQKARQGRNGRLLASLPDAFTKGDVIVARKKLGREGDVSYVISRWLAAGLIEKNPSDKQAYVKTHPQPAHRREWGPAPLCGAESTSSGFSKDPSRPVSEGSS